MVKLNKTSINNKYACEQIAWFHKIANINWSIRNCNMGKVQFSAPDNDRLYGPKCALWQICNMKWCVLLQPLCLNWI